MITTLAALALLAADDDWNFKLSLGFDASGVPRPSPIFE